MIPLLVVLGVANLLLISLLMMMWWEIAQVESKAAILRIERDEWRALAEAGGPLRERRTGSLRQMRPTAPEA